MIDAHSVLRDGEADIIRWGAPADAGAMPGHIDLEPPHRAGPGRRHDRGGGARGGELPTALVATTVKVWVVPFDKPVTVQEVVAELHSAPPGAAARLLGTAVGGRNLGPFARP